MTDETIKRANFGFDADFGDLSTVKPSGTPIKPKAVLKPKTVRKTPVKAKPKPAVRKAQDALADRLAQSQGFTSREATPATPMISQAAPLLMKKRRRVQHSEPVDQLSIRGPVRVLNGFIDYCEANKLSYWEGLERLVAEADQEN